MNQQQLVQKTQEFSEKYMMSVQQVSGIDLSEIEIVEDDWDTRFMWLATHLFVTIKLNEVYPGVKIEDLFQGEKLIHLYAGLVSNTMTILEQMEVDPLDTIRIIPNFFINSFK